jgi:predicted nucleic acid-binding Zn ribbon protein
MCGKTVHGSLLCDDCMKEILDKQRSRKYLLSLFMVIIIVGGVYFAWLDYQEKQSDIDTNIFKRWYDTAQESGFAFINSAWVFVPVLIFLIVIAFVIGTRISKG